MGTRQAGMAVQDPRAIRRTVRRMLHRRSIEKPPGNTYLLPTGGRELPASRRDGCQPGGPETAGETRRRRHGALPVLLYGTRRPDQKDRGFRPQVAVQPGQRISVSVGDADKLMLCEPPAY